MIARMWGTRGSLASSGAEMMRYGGNTSAIEIRAADGTVLALDAGTGIRPFGASIEPSVRRVDVLLTHLHMDHIQGLGFFAPFFRAGGEVHVWGPPSTTLDLRARLTRYLSPPLFPVRLRDLDARIVLEDVPAGPFQIGGLEVTAEHVIHPGTTIGYRIAGDGAVLAYLPDHEPALGAAATFPFDAAWTSGHALAAGADLLIHDAQYTVEERAERIGWGHSSMPEAVDFARQAGVRRLALFHHDPGHTDSELDALCRAAGQRAPDLDVLGAREGDTFELGA